MFTMTKANRKAHSLLRLLGKKFRLDIMKSLFTVRSVCIAFWWAASLPPNHC